MQVGLQTIMIVNKSHLLYFVTRYVRAFDNTDPLILRRLSLLYFVNRTLNFCWMSWWLVGTVFRFSKADCDAMSLMSLMLVQFIIQWCLAGLVMLAGCCSCGFLAILYCFFPQALVGGERITGATHAEIAKLKEEKYNPDDTKVKKEDALCAICLSPYEKNDKLRFLPCRHHFHSECIDQWLLKNKSCPFCKRLIDQPDSPSAPEHPSALAGEHSSLASLTSDEYITASQHDPSIHIHELGLSELDIHEHTPINQRRTEPQASSSSSAT